MNALSRLALPAGRPRLLGANHRQKLVRVRRTGALLAAVAVAFSGLAVPAAASGLAPSTSVAVVEHGDGNLAIITFTCRPPDRRWMLPPSRVPGR